MHLTCKGHQHCCVRRIVGDIYAATVRTIRTMGCLPLLRDPAPYFRVRPTYVLFQNFGRFSALRPIFRGALKSDDYGRYILLLEKKS